MEHDPVQLVEREEAVAPHGLKFAECPRRSRPTAFYRDLGSNIVYPALRLCGEAGETAERVKRAIRDDGGTLTEQRRQAIADQAQEGVRVGRAVGTYLHGPLLPRNPWLADWPLVEAPRGARDRGGSA